MTINMTKGIRGAITLEANTEAEVELATIELLTQLIDQNSIDKKMISHVIFTLTDDLDAAFPAKFARLNFGWDEVAMMCFNELSVENSLAMCLRILIVLNCNDDFIPKHTYLKKAKDLRPDFS